MARRLNLWFGYRASLVAMLLLLGLTPQWAAAAKAAQRAAAEKPAKVAKRASAAPKAESRNKASAERAAPAGSQAKASSRLVNGRSVKAKGQTVRLSRISARMTAAPLVPAIVSEGRMAGLHTVDDPLELRSGVALLIDRDSNEVLLSKNPGAVLPIASITKLMTALVVIESGLSLDEGLSIDQADVDETGNSRSRLSPGTGLSRGEMLRLALMSSENRAAHALSRHYPGGSGAFVTAMNRKAQALGMHDTRFVEATGLSADNRSSAMDLAHLLTAASAHDVIREFSTSKESVVTVGMTDKATQFRSTNGLIGNPDWDISLQKTGYIAAAGRCLVMQASLAGRRLTMVLLDSAGKYSRFGDAERIRKWLLAHAETLSAAVAVPAMELK